MSKTLWIITAVATAAVSIGMSYLLKSGKVDDLAEIAPNKTGEDTHHTETSFENHKETSETF